MAQTYASQPTGVEALLSGVVVKMGNDGPSQSS